MMTLRLRSTVLSLLLAASAGAFAQSASDKAARFYEDALKRYELRDFTGTIIQLKNALQVDKGLLPVHLLLGKAMLNNGDAAGAEFEFGEALRLGVNRAEVAVPLARAFVAQGKQSQVFDDVRLRVDGLAPSVQAELLLVRAAAYSDTGDMRSALKSIEDARSINPATAESWLAEIPIRVRSRQFAEATAAANQAIKFAPTSSDAVYQKASILHTQGQIQQALSLYERSLAMEAGNVEARLARAGILVDLGRDKEAQADIKELFLLAPNEPRAIYLNALLAERRGDINAAKNGLKRITEMLDPVPIEFVRFRPQALMLNGMAHFGLNEFEKAKPYLEYAARQQQNSPLTKMLAQVALAEPNVNRAIELLDVYLKARPGDSQALLMLASAHLSQGRHAKAAALMQEALRAKDAPEFHAALGLSLMRGGQSTTATEELEKAYKNDPKQAYAGLALVSIYLKSGKPAKAVTIADSLVKSSPNNLSMLLVQAFARRAIGDDAGARANYERVLKTDGTLMEARLGLARIDIAAKDYDAARKRLSEILRANDGNADAKFEMATLYEAWGKNDEAVKWLDGAVEASGPRETRANYALVAWHLRKGSPGKALAAAKVLLSKSPDDVGAMQVFASAQMANNDVAGARTTLTNASRRAAFEAPTQVEIAREQLRINDVAGAAYSLDKSLTAMPDYLPALVLMTAVELRSKEPLKAEHRARQIIQAYPKLGVGYGLLADIAQSRGQTAAALDALRRAHEAEPSSQSLLRLFAVQLGTDGKKPAQSALDLAEGWLRTHPKDTVIHKALADAQARAGNFPAAKRGYETVLKIRLDDAGALNNIANVLLRQNDPSALTFAERALTQGPRNPFFLDTAGWANHVAGNKDRAMQLLRDARLREPGNAEIRYHLGAVLSRAGRNVEAKEEIEAAIRTNVTFDGINDAKTLLATLK
jgi:putative PEP-CTERM system TPR-repeat lipoprotein